MATTQGLASFFERQAGLKEGTIAVEGGALSIPATDAAHLADTINKYGNGIITASDDGQGNAVIGASGVSMVTNFVNGDDFSPLLENPMVSSTMGHIQDALKKDVHPSNFKGASAPASGAATRNNAANAPELDQSPEALASRWTIVEDRTKVASVTQTPVTAVASKVPIGIVAKTVEDTSADTPIITAVANLEKMIKTDGNAAKSLNAADRGSALKYTETIRDYLMQQLGAETDEAARQTLITQLNTNNAAQSVLLQSGKLPANPNPAQDAPTRALKDLVTIIPYAELRKLQTLKVALGDYNKAVIKAKNGADPLSPGEITMIIQNAAKDPSGIEATLERVKEQTALLQPPAPPAKPPEPAQATGQLAQSNPHSTPDERIAIDRAIAMMREGKITNVVKLDNVVIEDGPLTASSTPKVMPGRGKNQQGGKGDNKNSGTKITISESSI